MQTKTLLQGSLSTDMISLQVDFRLVLLLSPVPAAVFSSKPHHGLPEFACVLLVNLVRKQWGAFLGAVALQATCREETKLIKKCGCFLQWKITSLLGFHPWHQVLGSSSLNRLLSARLSPSQCPGTLSEGEIIRKKCLLGMRSNGSLPDGDNHGSSNKPSTRQNTICLLAYINYTQCSQLLKHVRTERGGGCLLSFPPFQANPLVALWYMSGDPTVAPESFPRASLNFS